jgi:hypothetical protein
LNAARVALASEGREVGDALSLAEHSLQDLALTRSMARRIAATSACTVPALPSAWVMTGNRTLTSPT